MISKFLLTADKFMAELHLKHQEFIVLKRPLTKHHRSIQKFTETGTLKHLYINGFFTHDAAYSNIKDVAKRTISNKILKDRTSEIVRSRNYDGYQRALTSMVYTCFLVKEQVREVVYINN